MNNVPLTGWFINNGNAFLLQALGLAESGAPGWSVRTQFRSRLSAFSSSSESLLKKVLISVIASSILRTHMSQRLTSTIIFEVRMSTYEF